MAAMVARFWGETSASASFIRPAMASLAAALRPASTSSIARRLTCDESDSAAMRTNMWTSVRMLPSDESDGSSAACAGSTGINKAAMSRVRMVFMGLPPMLEA
jgi:hypothetical protein